MYFFPGSLHNDGAGHFSDITRSASVSNPLWGASAAFFDYDRDGWLDIVLVNYLDYDPSRPCTNGSGQRDYCGPAVFGRTATKLFHNHGRGPTVRSGLKT
ncbi:FG-GAP repeat domain-containing protein [Fimbriiglobus ruber]|uniref:FG-GAP repeat domain-containing protein n=1 Tax=Fimbriiglobus ruber TaxID=1908690 RepID=UPI003B84B65B